MDCIVLSSVAWAKLPTQFTRRYQSHSITPCLKQRQIGSRARQILPYSLHSTVTTDVVDWISSQGVDVAKLGVAVSPSGLIASRPVSKGEVMAVIPESCWITKETAAQSQLGPYVRDLEPWLAVALFLAAEHVNPSSPWSAYLASLPNELASPVAWPDAELELLRGTQLLHSVQGYRDFFTRRYEQLEAVFAPNPQVFPSNVFTYESFLWAACTVRARTHAPLDGEDVALIQHARGEAATAKWEVKSGLFGRGRALIIEATRALHPGETVSMDYSPGRTEGQTLLDHGVVDGAGAAGTFALTLTLPEDDRFFDDKIDILEQAGLSASNEFILSSGAPAPNGLLAMLRLVNIQGADAFLLESIFRGEVWEHMQLPLSEENERAVYQSLTDGCAAVLGSYPTSVEEDVAALRVAAPGSRDALAAKVRLGEKEALGAAAAFFEGRLGQLASFEYYGDRRLKGLGLLDKEGKPTDWESFFDEGLA